MTEELVFEVALGSKADEVRKFRIPLGHGIAGLVAVSGQPMAISDARTDPRQAADVAESVGYAPESFLCVPPFYEEEFTGVLELLDREGAPSYSAADIEEPTELALVWEAELTSWVVEGEAAECRLNEKRAKVVRALAEAGGPVSPRQVTDAVEAGYEATRQRLYQMSRSGEILAVGRGRYTVPNRPNNANNDPAANGGDVREVRMVRGARATYPPTPPMLGMLGTLGRTPTTFHSTTSPTGCSKRGTRTTTLVTNTVMVITMGRIIHPIVDAMNACRSRRSSCVPQRIPEGLSRCLVPQPNEGAKTSCDSLPPNVS